jgi:hypothetical protein
MSTLVQLIQIEFCCKKLDVMYELRIVKEGLLVMAECRTCGKFLHEEATICPSCRDPDPIVPEPVNLPRWLQVVLFFAGLAFMFWLSGVVKSILF